MQVHGREPVGPGARGRLRLGAGLWAGLGAVATLTWVAFAAAMAGRGFGGGNEGYYVLSYEYWDTSTRTFSMAQYLYGPVFDLLGQDVVLLRLFRLVLILAVHALFGWQFTAWLATVREEGSTRLSRSTGVLAITASAGVVYGWLPATPGYNDLTVLGAMCLLACFFRLQVRRAAGLRPGVLGCAAFGAVVVVMVMAKATMIPCVVVATVALCLAAGSRRDRVVVLGWVAAGAGFVLLFVHLLVKPLDEAVPPLLETLRVVGGSAHRPIDLARTYLTSVAQAVGLGAIAFVAPGLALMVALRRGTGRLADLAPWIAVGLNLALVGLAGGLHGGLGHVGAYQAGIVAMVLTGIVAASWGKVGRQGTASAGLVLAMPVLAALGTNNPLMAVAVGGAAMWVAVLVFLGSGIASPARAQRTLAALATAGAVTICLSVSVTGVTHTRTGESLLDADGRHVAGVPVLASVTLPDAAADRVERLRTSLAPYVEPAGRPMIAFGELADDVVVLNGRPVGNAWFSAGEDGLQAADLRAACAHGNPWRRQPVVLTIRELTDRERAGFEACGLDLARDYVEVAPVGSDSELRALVPRSDRPSS